MVVWRLRIMSSCGKYSVLKLDYKENSSRFDKASFEKASRLINEGKIEWEIANDYFFLFN